MNKYKVYVVSSAACYIGTALVAADTAEEANSYLDGSMGHTPVEEIDAIGGVYSENKGMVYSDIFYSGIC